MKKGDRAERIQAVVAKLKHHNSEIQRLEHQLLSLKGSQPIEISNHAIVRYMERVKGVNMLQVKEEILTPYLLNLYHRIGDGTLPIAATGNVRVVVERGRIVTVLT